MTTPSAAGHPDTDLLADLAAEVLPPEQARLVEQHVQGCARCAGLLADGERVPTWLRDQPLEPIPVQVVEQLEATLRRQARWDPVQGWDLAQGGMSPPGSGDEPPPLPTGSLPTGSLPTGSLPAADPRAGVRMLRPGRTTNHGQPSRRQARQDERDQRPLWARPIVAAAAAVILVIGLGGTWWVSSGGLSLSSSDSHSATAGGGTSEQSAESVAPVPVLATGTDYTSAGLVTQAKALIEQASRASSQADVTASGAGGTEGADGANTAAPPAATAPTTSRLATPLDQPGQLLRDPVALDDCLRAIDSEGVRPIAVDLATYQGREAAILVLPGPAGGFEVWAVSRGCKPGADGTLVYRSVS